MSNTIPPKALFEISMEAQELITKLRALPTDETLTVADICEVTKRPYPQSRGVLETAFKHLRAEGMEFCAVRNVGIRKLTNEEIPDLGTHYVVKTHRTAARGVKRMTTCEYNSLPRSAQNKYNANMAQLSMAGAVTNVYCSKRMSKAIADTGAKVQQIDISQVVKQVIEQMDKK